MKFVLTLITLAIVASVQAAPSQPLDKYTESLIKVNQIKNLVIAALDEVVRRSVQDNASVGEQIKERVHAGAAEAEVVFEYLQTELDAKRLTAEQAETSLTELNQILDKSKREIEPFVLQLSQAVQDHIVNVFTVTYGEAARIVEQIFELLYEKKLRRH